MVKKMIEKEWISEIVGNKPLRAFVWGGDRPATMTGVVRLSLDMQISGGVRVPKNAEVFGIEADGKIVSWAAAWQPDRHGIRQITVETDIAYRGRGYAAECLKALAEEISEPLLYLCKHNNIASAKTAIKAGFVEVIFK